MIEPTTDREKLVSLDVQLNSLNKELELLLKSLAAAESENARLRGIAQRDAAFNDQKDKNVITHLFDIIKLGGAVIAGLLGIKYGMK